MTHRQFSRNAASSRAIPISKQIKAVEENPAHPERWGTNGKGMQDHGLHSGPSFCESSWNRAKEWAIGSAKDLDELGLHKQIVNRVLEPFSHITVLITATEWDNFFALRAHPDAQPEFQVLAYRMLDNYQNSVPDKLEWNEWHLPLAPEPGELSNENRLLCSVANAARTSYTTHDGDFDIQKQTELVNRLASGGHWSPFEHQAQASPYDEHFISGNFKGGWLQYRQTFRTQEKKDVDLASLLANKPDWITL